MPPRLARSSVSVQKPQNARKKSQKRSLDAFSIASHSVPQKTRIKQHRLGESESFEPRQKRQRLEDDDEDEDGEENASNARRLQAKTVTKRTGGLDDSVEQGSDSEGNEWTVGGQIGEDSDSSIDSDEAFGESDEERFEGFTFRGSSSAPGPKKAKKRVQDDEDGEMDLAEDDEEGEEEDDFGDEGVDLATMLDEGNDGILNREERGDDEGSSADDNDSMSGASDSDVGEENSETSASEPESDDADPEKLSKLQDLIASLDRELPQAKKYRTSDMQESQQPSEFGTVASRRLNLSGRPSADQPATSTKASKLSSKSQKLEAPLPKRQQDRLDRRAASQKAKETLDRWRDTVIRNRRADHLQFPLKDPSASEPVGTSRLVTTQQEKPKNDLEDAIQNILEESGLSTAKRDGGEELIQQAEELQLNKIPIEEVMARRAELRKQRDLLFREEIKAKRIKKIKSKSYRRVHRREREREAALIGEAEDDMEDGKERQDRRRAEERMGAKHRESKWAKGMKKSGRTVWDDDARDGVMDMARRNEELRRRIEGKDVRNEEDDEGTASSEDDTTDAESGIGDDNEETSKIRFRKSLDKLSGDGQPETSKLGQMAFMQKADAARKAQNDEDIERMRREIAGEETPSESEDEAKSIGRRVFGPKADASKRASQTRGTPGEFEERVASDDDEEDAEIIVDGPSKSSTQSNKAKSRPASKDAFTRKTNGSTPLVNGDDDDDAWLQAATGTRKTRKGKDESDFVPAPEIKKAEPVAAKPANVATQAKDKKPEAHDEKDADDADDADDTTQDPILTDKERQEMYWARAFAGDEVGTAFEDEKADQMKDEDEKEISNVLPGWGSWAGSGLTKSVKKANARRAHNPLYKTKVDGVRAADRKDAKLKNVIISEAQQRKGKKYLASQLPHGFERKEQYERSLRIPVGPEWTTKETFQKNTKPRLIVKQGVIEAMEKPLL